MLKVKLVKLVPKKNLQSMKLKFHSYVEKIKERALRNFTSKNFYEKSSLQNFTSKLLKKKIFHDKITSKLYF